MDGCFDLVIFLVAKGCIRFVHQCKKLLVFLYSMELWYMKV